MLGSSGPRLEGSLQPASTAHAMVLTSPSLSAISGCQPRADMARAMSATNRGVVLGPLDVDELGGAPGGEACANRSPGGVGLIISAISVAVLLGALFVPWPVRWRD